MTAMEDMKPRSTPPETENDSKFELDQAIRDAAGKASLTSSAIVSAI